MNGFVRIVESNHPYLHELSLRRLRQSGPFQGAEASNCALCPNFLCMGDSAWAQIEIEGDRELGDSVLHLTAIVG